MGEGMVGYSRRCRLKAARCHQLGHAFVAKRLVVAVSAEWHASCSNKASDPVSSRRVCTIFADIEGDSGLLLAHQVVSFRTSSMPP